MITPTDRMACDYVLICAAQHYAWLRLRNDLVEALAERKAEIARALRDAGDLPRYHTVADPFSPSPWYCFSKWRLLRTGNGLDAYQVAGKDHTTAETEHDVRHFAEFPDVDCPVCRPVEAQWYRRGLQGLARADRT